MALFLLALLRMGAGQLTQVFIDRIPGDLEPLGHKRHRLAEGESVLLVQKGDDLHPVPLVQGADRLANGGQTLVKDIGQTAVPAVPQGALKVGLRAHEVHQNAVGVHQGAVVEVDAKGQVVSLPDEVEGAAPAGPMGWWRRD